MHLIPEAALDKHVALLGMTGAGKSSVIKAAIVEPDLDADRRVLIITPKDDWWGLRLSKSGKSQGYPIPVFGGWHGDYPLLVKDAALLAETYGTMKGSAIFCTSRLSGQDRARWFAAFAETLLTKNRGWVRVVIDEAHVFMPKQGGKGGGAIPAALHAGNELVSQGRSPGIRIVLASQRSAKLHNDSLTQCSCLIAMMLMAPHDRDAVKDWIADQADPEKGKEIISSLATLNTAEAWVWAPAAKMLEKIQFPWPKTFDSNKAADDGAGSGPVLPPINLDALKGKLATIEAEKKADDPKALRARIAELERNLKAAQTQTLPHSVDPDAIAKAEQRGFEQAKRKLAAEAEKEFKVRIGATLAALRTAGDAFAAEVKTVINAAVGPADLKAPIAFSPPAPVLSAVPTATPRAPPRAKPTAPAGDGALTGPQLKLLQALAWWARMGHERPHRRQAAAIAGWKPTGSNLKDRLSELKGLGLVDYPATGLVALTEAGAAAAPEPNMSSNLVDGVRGVLTGPQLSVFNVLLANPGAMARDILAGLLDWQPNGSNLKDRLSELKGMEIITYPSRGVVALADWVSDEALRSAAA